MIVLFFALYNRLDSTRCLALCLFVYWSWGVSGNDAVAFILLYCLLMRDRALRSVSGVINVQDSHSIHEYDLGLPGIY